MRKYTLVVLFSLLLIELLALQLLTPPTIAQTIPTKVTYDPARIDLSVPLPMYINATISSRDPLWNASLVDGNSILLDKTLLQFSGHVITKFNDYVAVFDGPSVIQIIWQKLYHMGVVDPTVHKPYKVELSITGKLNGTILFEGIGIIMVKMYSATLP